MNVQENHIRQGYGCNGNKTLFQSLREDGFVAFGFEPMLQKFAIIRVVIDHKNPLLHSFSSGESKPYRQIATPAPYYSHTIVPIH